MSDRIQEIKARHLAATPGPYMWDARSCNHSVKLVTTHSGQYFVMGMTRWGTQGAAPEFQVFDRYAGPLHERGSRGMRRVEHLLKSIPGKEHHDGWDDFIDHPDAIAIEKSWEDVDFLLAQNAALQAENERMKTTILAGVIDSDLVKLYDGSALERADNYIAKLEAENATLREAQRWIPVSEQEPPDPGKSHSVTYNVIVDKFDKNEVMSLDWANEEVRGKRVCRWKWHSRISDWTVTHWMPLPAAPDHIGNVTEMVPAALDDGQKRE